LIPSLLQFSLVTKGHISVTQRKHKQPRNISKAHMKHQGKI